MAVPVSYGTRLPVKTDLGLVYRMTWVIALLLAACSIAGLLLGRRVLYDSSAVTTITFLSQDATTLGFGLPLLLVCAWLTRRGSTRALLCWLGTLFYIAYSYYFYVVGVRLNYLLPVYIALVSMSMYGALALLFALDLDELRTRFSRATPVRIISVFLTGFSVVFALLWLGMIASHVMASSQLDPVARAVIAVDGVVLLPLLCVGGLWLWQKRPLGFALGGLLLAKATATFLTLIISTIATRIAGERIDVLQSSLFALGFLGGLTLLIVYLRSVQDSRPAPI